jgi:magnesium chelatase family protein
MMTLGEAIETTRRHRVAGRTGARTALVMIRSFPAPHQTVSDVRLIGSGHLPMPGEVARAQRGVLCLDERMKFRPYGLEVLRQPLEMGVL